METERAALTARARVFASEYAARYLLFPDRELWHIPLPTTSRPPTCRSQSMSATTLGPAEGRRARIRGGRSEASGENWRVRCATKQRQIFSDIFQI